ncbi:hypothetical protein [Burkholderia phage FLC9]|nr:hypothetical protein [Burkholderia phage FLC9]
MFGVNVVKRTTIKNRVRIRNATAKGNSQSVSGYQKGALQRRAAEQGAMRRWIFEGIVE